MNISSNKSRLPISTNGALTYALKDNRITLFELVALGEQKAKQLKWVKDKVWNDAKIVINNASW